MVLPYENEGDTILDPTAGSFNSGRSALGLERNYIGMEMNEEFYDNNKI
jgi:DNA modification methylase